MPEPHELLSPAEHDVLSIFRTYLMAPGRMLCLDSSDVQVFAEPLAQLVHKGLLVVERRRGAYSLTAVGFAAMKHGQ